MSIPQNPKRRTMLVLLARLEIPVAHAVAVEVWAGWLAKYMPGDYLEPVPPQRATAARPGSPAKVEVMRRRLERGEALHHSLDADPQGFLELGTVFGFSKNGEHPRLGIFRLRAGLGVRAKPDKGAHRETA